MGKGEIARYEQFLLFPQCFQKACFPGASKCVIVWEWFNGFLDREPTIRDGALIRRNMVCKIRENKIIVTTGEIIMLVLYTG